MSLVAAGTIEIPDSLGTAFDHGAFEPESRRVFIAQRREFLLERLTCRRSRSADNWNQPAERGLIVRSHPGPGILGRMHHELAVRGLYGRLFRRYHVTGAGAAKHNAVDAPAHRPRHHWLLASQCSRAGVNLEAGEGGVHPGAGPQINRRRDCREGDEGRKTGISCRR